MMVAETRMLMNGKVVVGAIAIFVTAIAIYEFLLVKGLAPNS